MSGDLAVCTEDHLEAPLGWRRTDRRVRGADPFTRRLAILVLVVTGVSAFLAGGHSYAIDNEVQFQTTRALVHLSPSIDQVDQGWFDNPQGPYRTRSDGNPVAIVPIGQSLLSVPFYLAGRAGAVLVHVDQRDQFVRTATFFTGSVLLALTAAAVALIAAQLGEDRRIAILLGYVFAFGTYALGNSSTYLTEIGASLFLALAAWCALRCRERAGPRIAAWCGVAAGAGVMVRPSSALFVPVIGLWLLVVLWRRSGWRPALTAGAGYGAGAVALLAINSAFNWWRFESPFDLGYQHVYQDNSLISGLTGQLWSSGKGLLWYAPIVAVSAVGAVLLIRRRTAPVVLLVGLATLNTVFYARVPFWSGDNSWGPRYTLIVLPVLVPLAIGVERWRAGIRSIQVTGAIGLLLVGIPGALVNFNVLYIRATSVIGPGGEVPAIRNDIDWQPMLRTVEMLPAAVEDLWDADPDGEPQRPAYDRNPDSDYGFYGIEPRIDTWWAWIGPTSASGLTWLFLLPTIGCLGAAAWLGRRGRGAGMAPGPRATTGRVAQPRPRHRGRRCPLRQRSGPTGR